MAGSRALGAGVVVLLGLALGGWLWWDGGAAARGAPTRTSGDAARDVDEGRRVDVGVSTDDAPARAGAERGPAVGDASARRSLSAGRSLRVVDPAGDPVPGARAWFVTEAQVGAQDAGHLSQYGEAAEPARTEFRTGDREGLLALPADEELQRHAGGWLWIAAEGYAARAVAVDRLLREVPAEVALEPAPARRVRVVDGSGRAVASARVVHLRADASRPRFREVVEVGADGAATLAFVEGEQRVWARAGERRSSAWVGRDPDGVRLELVDAFAIDGTVEPAEGAGPLLATARVVVRELRGTLRHEHASVSPAGGRFGPLLVPWSRGAAFEVALEGPGLATDVAFVEASGAERGASVTLRAEAGARLRARVSTADGAPIRGAKASVGREDEDGRWSSVELHADDEGRFDSAQFAPGTVRVAFRAPGYCAEQVYALLVPNAEELWVGMRPAEPLEGVVLYEDGRPASDFELLAWTPGNPVSLVRHVVRGARDGSFAFEDGPPGELYVLAVAPDSPGSEALRVLAGSEDARAVRLTLQPAAPFELAVVDAVDGEPIEEAGVQRMVASPDGPIATWGPPLRAAAGGRVAAPGPSRSPIVLEVAAEGYEARMHRASASSERPIDLGRVELRRARALTVRVLADEGSRRPPAACDDWLVWLAQGGTTRPYATLGADGEHVFEDVAAGTVAVFLWRTDHASKQVLEGSFAADEDEVELVVGGGRTVDVRLLEADGEPYLGRAYVNLTYELGGTVATWEQPIERGRLAHFEGVDQPRAFVKVFSEHLEPLARRGVTLPEGQTTLDVRLGGEESVLRVVDASGAPVAGALVYLVPPHGAAAYHRERTETDGTLRILGREHERFEASVHLQDGTLYGGLEVDFAGQAEATLRLGPAGDLHVRCIDGDVELPGVDVALVDPFGLPIRPTRSDGSGLARLSGLGQGRYELTAGGEGIWPARLEADFTPGAEPTRFELRRTGDLELQAVDSDGAPVAGATLRLTWRPTGESVADWIEAGRVEGSLPLRTSGAGLSLRGLPRGTYDWSASAGSRSGTGSLTVEPATRTTVRIELTGE